ncbi:MAG TPA: NAD(P)-dependent oxidoreductase [Verrucomicrobia bacterium]|nr:NAD(P)-dependent oxidoreductase [Verrucomicrobiota bacterium]HOB33940.1 NAD(P)-dependent oxidoreductase [Verrucomicrobiota bacterium]HOP95959.1 NAD(P)-dependent oxidoreductase [Verrucomicrobiota bacterium]HPU55740.1 NAD(P)-dependent oxidoreductase [Verrucomicrobiota bacterium]
MRVTLIGANGFVGSAFARLLERRPDVTLVRVTRENFAQLPSIHSDVVIEAACNSKKYLAEEDPAADFALSVQHRLESLRRFTADVHIHISSVDVYADLSSPETTHEDTPVPPRGPSRYGFHKHLAELLVQHYAPAWLIVRLAGMVGPGLRKNPVFDILNGNPLRIHPDSRYQYLLTDEVARITWTLFERGFRCEIFNVCGSGVVTMREIAKLAGRELNLSLQAPDWNPRVVEASIEKLARVLPVMETRKALEQFFASMASANRAEAES